MKVQVPTQERISKGKGRLMIGIGLLFDLLPVLILLVVFVTGIYFIVTTSGLTELADDIAAVSDSELRNSDAGNWEKVIRPISGWWGIGKAAATVGLGTILGTVVGVFFILPMLYTITSFMSVFVGYLFFTFWFMFNGVYIWSFSKPKKILVTLTTAFLETIPLVNLLPGITVMVWRHVKYTQMEDALENKETVAKTARMIQKVAPA